MCKYLNSKLFSEATNIIARIVNKLLFRWVQICNVRLYHVQTNYITMLFKWKTSTTTTKRLLYKLGNTPTSTFQQNLIRKGRRNSYTWKLEQPPTKFQNEISKLLI